MITLSLFQSLIAQIENPALSPAIRGLTGQEFFADLLPRLVALGLIFGIVVFFFIMLIGAIRWMTSGGDKAGIEAARSNVVNALIGIIILFSLFAIIRLIETFFGVNILQIKLPQIGGGGSGCFLAGTKVKMADGTYKEIQEIKPGDIVYSYDLESGTLVENKVEKLFTHRNYPRGYLIINGELKVTGNHGMWVVNRGAWERADKLSLGDSLLSPSGEETLITSIKTVGGKNTVYNLHLEGQDHNYFTEGVLVHNIIFQK